MNVLAFDITWEDVLWLASDSGAQYREGGGDSFPPYMEDYFQRIVNVSFGGLAVEFFDGAT